ncbi:hypothetical protein BD770DRAFT_142245 [Pilaira anomala]|nr:hypothetical protein BD770DRAFT_142245 [Pilaira anomala]
MYSDLIRERSVPPPVENKPRTIRRMMLDQVQSTVIPWECYSTDKIIRKEKTNQDKNTNLQKGLRFPSIAFNPFQKNNFNLVGEELAFFIITDSRNRFFFPGISDHELNTEFARKNIEKSRRADHRQSFYSSSGSGIHLRSSSDLTITPDMHSLDLSEMDLPDARNIQDSFNITDDVDYDYISFDEGYPSPSSNDKQCEHILQEMRLFLPDGNNKIQLDDLFQLKSRSGISQLFYYTLELASKKMIQPSQTEPYGPIEIQLV